MKKKIIIILSIVLCFVLCISLVACNKNKHEPKDEWTTSDAMHWKDCSTEGHTDKLNEGEHTFDSGKITTPATEEAEGVKTFTCTVCGYQKTESVPQAGHTFSDKWTSDETHHWHNATCAHTDEKSGYEEHKGEWTTKTEANYGVDKVEERTCTVCGKHQEKTIENSALAPKDNTVTVGAIDFTYNAKSQPIELVKVDNKEGMVIKYIGVDGTTYEESTTAPTNAGDYQYTITIPATAEWKAVELSGKYTINSYELAFLYEKQTIEFDGKKQDDGTKRIWFRFETLEDNTGVNIAVIMDSASVGAKVSYVCLPGLLDNSNYSVDESKIQIEIVAKKLSNLKFEIVEDDVDELGSEQTITREIEGVNNEIIIVEITFNPEELRTEGALDLSFDGKGGAVCIIKFQTENPNYILDLNLGELILVTSETV